MENETRDEPRGFEIAKLKPFFQKVQGGRQYLTVAGRLLWFRTEHPDWSIETEALQIDMEKGLAIFKATIKDEQGRVLSTGTKMQLRSKFADFGEKCETGAIGRALLFLNYGTDSAADELEEGERWADSPQATRPQTPAPRQPLPANGRAETPAQKARREWEERQRQQTASEAGDDEPLDDPFGETDELLSVPATRQGPRSATEAGM